MKRLFLSTAVLLAGCEFAAPVEHEPEPPEKAQAPEKPDCQACARFLRDYECDKGCCDRECHEKVCLQQNDEPAVAPVPERRLREIHNRQVIKRLAGKEMFVEVDGTRHTFKYPFDGIFSRRVWVVKTPAQTIVARYRPVFGSVAPGVVRVKGRRIDGGYFAVFGDVAVTQEKWRPLVED